MFQKFRETFNGTPGTPQKKSVRRSRSTKSPVFTSPKNILILRETGRTMMMRKTRKKKHKKVTAVQKETITKRTQPKRAARFNKEIIVVVG